VALINKTVKEFAASAGNVLVIIGYWTLCGTAKDYLYGSRLLFSIAVIKTKHL